MTGFLQDVFGLFRDFLKKRSGRRVANNFSYIIIGEILAKLIGFLAIVFIARTLSPELYGQYNTVISYVTFFLIVIDMGINSVVVREGSKDISNINNYMNKVLVFKAYLSVAAVILILISLLFVPYPPIIKSMIAIASMYIVLQGLKTFIECSFRITENMKFIAFSRILERTIFLLMALVFLHFHAHPISVVYAIITSFFVSLMANFYFSRRYVSYYLSWKVDWVFTKKLVKPAIWFGLAAFFTMIYSKLDVLMVSFLSTMVQVGFYAGAWQLVNAGVIMRGAIYSAFFPMSARKIPTSREYVKKLFFLLLAISILASVVTLALSIFSAEIIGLIFGERYDGSVPVLSILIWYVPLSVLGLWGVLVLDSTNNQKIHTYTTLFMAVVNVAFNIVLIPSLGAVGAAIASIVSGVLGLALVTFFGYKKWKEVDYGKKSFG